MLSSAPAVSLVEGIGDGAGEVRQSQRLGKHGEDGSGFGAGDDLIVEGAGDKDPGGESQGGLRQRFYVIARRCGGQSPAYTADAFDGVEAV